jgi:signal transduction histidine kinase
VYESGNTFVSGRLGDDSEELRGVRGGLGIQSEIGVPLVINGRRAGMILIASQQPDFFQPKDVEFAESVAQWVAMVAHRAELVQEITFNAMEQGRRKVAEELITVLAHDLRNYIAPIHARLHLLHTRANRQNRPEDSRDADLALKGVDRLTRLISAILDVARLDQGIFQIETQPVDLGGAAREMSKAMATPDHELVVNIEDDVIVAADPHRLQQCMDTIISNAIRHSPDNAPVRLVVKKRNREQRVFGILEVHNEGPGIPVDLMPRLFDRFARGPESQGLGLGLYMAKRIAVAHGGELTAVSPIGEGACFSLRLPCYEPL